MVREPLVRTVHSYAFAVLRLAAQRNGSPPPRLITSAEQDGIIRELLAGDVEDGDASPVRWPARLRPALSTVGFATELRDLMARCSERGVDPAALQRIGRLSGRPEWQAAGRFAQAYEQVMLLRSAVGMAAPQATVPALGAAELVGAALEAFAIDADLLAAERARVRCSWSTTPNTSTRRPPGWCRCWRPGPSSRSSPVIRTRRCSVTAVPTRRCCAVKVRC